MKLTEVVIENEAGEQAKIARKEYVAAIVKELGVEDYTTEETGTTPADKVVNHILKSYESETEVDDGIQGSYSDLCERIEEDYKRSVAAKIDKKQAAAEEKAKKEEEKAKREAEEKAKAEALVITQNEFALSAAAGADLAAKEFKIELETLAGNLPKGVTVKHTGTGYGLEFEGDATKETIGQTLGYLMQKDNNSEFIGNQLTFWIGDTITKTVALGIYDTAKSAAKHIAGVWSEKAGKTIEAASLDQYKRMAERTPVEFRNPKADPTAYLAISTAKAPRKAENEKDDKFKARLAKFEEDRAGLQKMLAVGELVKRKDVVPLVNDMLIKHGIKEAPDPNAVVISISQQFALFFHATFGIEELVDVHKEGLAIYKDGDNLMEVTKEELEGIQASAKANLLNALYSSEKLGLSAVDYIRGKVSKKAMIEVAKDADGKPIKEEQTINSPVYPQAFFSRPEEEKAEEPAK